MHSKIYPLQSFNLKQFQIHFFSPFLFYDINPTTIEIKRTYNVFTCNLDTPLLTHWINPMTIEVKGWIAILIAYRGDSVFISRLVIMRAGRFSVDGYHPSMLQAL